MRWVQPIIGHSGPGHGTHSLNGQVCEEGLMRADKNNRKNAILAGLVTVAIGVFCLSTVGNKPQPPIGSARLVSMTQMPDIGDSCYLPVSAEKPETSLFDSFEQSAYAADTLDVT